MMLQERDGELYYIADDGTEYQLLECVTMGGDKTSDIVAVFKEGDDGFPVFVNWFAGASLYGWKNNDEFLYACKQFIEGV